MGYSDSPAPHPLLSYITGQQVHKSRGFKHRRACAHAAWPGETQQRQKSGHPTHLIRGPMVDQLALMQQAHFCGTAAHSPGLTH